MPSPLLIHILPTNRWNGVGRYALDICRYFLSEGWDVAAITRDARAVDSFFEKEGIRLLHAPFYGMLDVESVRLLSSTLKDAPLWNTVIHVHGFRNACTALLARRISRRPDVKIVMTRHKVKKGIDSWIFRRIYRRLDSIIFVSELARQRFLSTWQRRSLPFPEDILHTLHNSLNTSLQPIEPRLGKGPVFAMFHGPLLPGKGVEDLIDAMALLKNQRLRLRIAGNGNPDYIDRLRRRAMARGVMEMIDWHRQVDDVLPLIRECDFGVLPSRTEEAFGLANIEYMICGKPQVCSSNGAQPE